MVYVYANVYALVWNALRGCYVLSSTHPVRETTYTQRAYMCPSGCRLTCDVCTYFLGEATLGRTGVVGTFLTCHGVESHCYIVLLGRIDLDYIRMYVKVCSG